MSKIRMSYEEKLAAVERYRSGEASVAQMATELRVGENTIRDWLQKYKTFGPIGLECGKQNQRYDAVLKAFAVQEYLSGEGSLAEICKKHKIHSGTQLRSWIKLYNGHKELRTSGRHGSELNMTKGKPTTLEERIEIVSFCIEHEKDYAGTVEKYGVSYQQIYSWVKKYRQRGVEGLVDRRGKKKDYCEMTETERLRAENRLLQAQLKEKELEVALLKKLEDMERRGC